jgi:hypothetical protein
LETITEHRVARMLHGGWARDATEMIEEVSGWPSLDTVRTENFKQVLAIRPALPSAVGL